MKSIIQQFSFLNIGNMNKNYIITIAVVSTVITGLGSCSKCEVCTKANASEVRVCEKDYNSKTQYNLTLDSYEANGYVCKSSI